jgi:SAM-dependent methyltransferase
MGPFDLDARAAWNAGAAAYTRFVESGADYYRHLVHGPALLEACGDVRGVRALDVGCGQGYFSRLFARAGATVTGIDIADALVARAAELEAAGPLGVTYLRMDAAAVAGHFGPGTFDLVTGCMSVQDTADPAAVLAGAYQVLGPGGRLVFSVPHPATDTPVREWKRDDRGVKLGLFLDRYFDTGPAVCDWNMARLAYPWSTPYHRFTLTEWGGLIRDAGFVIRSLREPRPAPDLVAARPELDDCSRMPFFLIFEAVKGASWAG